MTGSNLLTRVATLTGSRRGRVPANGSAAIIEERQPAYRIVYADYLRIFAALIVLNSNFAAATFDGRTNSMPLDQPQGIFRDQSWAITLLFMVSGRVLTASSMPPGPNGTSGSFKPHYPLLVSSMFRRAFRFILPVIAVAFMQWQLCAAGHTGDAADAHASVFTGAGSVAMAQGPAGWCRVGNFTGLIVYVVNLFTFNGPNGIDHSQALGSMLWTTTWAMWGSYTVYLTAFLTAQLASNRYVIFLFLMTFSWATFSWNWVFLLGYILADMRVHGHLVRPRSRIVAIACQIVAIVLAVGIVWVTPVRTALDSVGTHLQITYIDVVDNQSHSLGNANRISLANSLSCFFLMMFFELTSEITSHGVLSRAGKHIGHLSAGIVVLHPTYLYTVVPSLGLSLSRNGASFSSIVGLSWLALVALVIPSAFFFYHLVERQSVLLGDFFWNWLAKPVEDLAPSPPGAPVRTNTMQGDRYALISERTVNHPDHPPIPVAPKRTTSAAMKAHQAAEAAEEPEKETIVEGLTVGPTEHERRAHAGPYIEGRHRGGVYGDEGTTR
ncbi:hypothetical protein HKX48_001525, partial [Thoreauomyces humboldtii]